MVLLAPYLPPLLGGVLIGLAAGAFRLFANEIAGISGIFRGALTGPGRRWCGAFLLGLLMAGILAVAAGDSRAARGIEQLSLPIAVVAGLLVGLGAGLSNGCTSGHGVCGLARLSPRSLVAVLTFMATAGLTVLILRHGFRP